MRNVITVHYHNEEKLKKHIDSLSSCNSFYDGFFLWCNGGLSVEMADHTESRTNLRSMFQSPNVGKARAVNKLLLESGFVRDSDYVCIADGDIVFDPKTLDVLFDYAEVFGGIVVPEHTGNRCHTYKAGIHNVVALQNTKDVGVSSVPKGAGVAGVCMTMQVELFRELGGFEENSVYGGNESGLWHKYDKPVVVLKEFNVFHPEEKDIGYHEHKVRCQRDIRLKGFSRRKGYYDKQGVSKVQNRTDIINKLIQDNDYQTYLEIGACGVNFKNVTCKDKTGVDKRASGDITHCMASDQYFDELEEDKKFDIVFVDGNHLYEPALKDIQNSLKHLAEGGTVVVHDVLPPNEAYQGLRKVADGWCGKVWQAMLWVATQKDLKNKVVNIDNGVGIITVGKNRNRQRLDREPNKYHWVDFSSSWHKWFNVVTADEFFASKKKDTKKGKSKKQDTEKLQ